MFRMDVRVSLLPGVLDAEGKNTLKALHLLGFERVRGVSVSKVYTLEVDADSREEAEQICEKVSRTLLANPVIHESVVSPAR